MLFQKFLTYDPYLTFSSSLNTCLIDRDGKEVSDTQSLFNLGEEAYKYFVDGIESSDDFDELMASYLETINEHRQLLSKKNIKCKSTASGKEFTLDWSQAEDCQVISAAWQIYSSQQSQVDDSQKFFYAELYFVLVLIEIDYANMSMIYNPADAITSAIEAANALANAVAIKSEDEKLHEIRKGIAYRAAMARLEVDPKQNDKKFVFTCWQEWQNSPERYASKAAFARDMLDKCDHLVSNKKIEDWCREWEKPNPAS